TVAPLQKSWDLGVQVFHEAKNADALYFPGAPQPCVDNIEGLERELGTFVISSLQASMWKALSIIGYKTPVPGYGKLLRDLCRRLKFLSIGRRTESTCSAPAGIICRSSKCSKRI